jgi:flagellar assembly factor FliW
MKAETTRFGTIDVKEKSIISMPDGMLGFEHCKRFALLEEAPGAAFKWMQSIDDPAVAFIVINPVDFFPSYGIDVPDEQVARLGIEDAGEAAILTTVTVRREQGTATTNLSGPIVLNTRTLSACQIVVQDDRYSTSYVITSQESSQGETRELVKAA